MLKFNLLFYWEEIRLQGLTQRNVFTIIGKVLLFLSIGQNPETVGGTPFPFYFKGVGTIGK